MKKVIVLIVLLLPCKAYTQGKYTGITAGISYSKFMNLTGLPVPKKYWNTALAGSIEHYFKFGLKISAGVSLRYGRDSYYINIADPSFAMQTYKLTPSYIDIDIPFTVGYNITPRLHSFQLFIFSGYCRNYNISSTQYKFSPNGEAPQPIRDRYKKGIDFLLYGIEMRLDFLKKYYGGLSLTIVDYFNPDYYVFLRQPRGEICLKAGVKLFQ
ncbi:MAG TPA: hypothetical protein VEC12_12460 [Bacteroidia bacterium]|nr:hypothetical protein [Bacteroidia bacterium]